LIAKLMWLARAGAVAALRPRMNRQKGAVVEEYDAAWQAYSQFLAGCTSLDQWLKIKAVEDVPHYCNVEGALQYQAFHSDDYNRRHILATIRREFPDAKSVTEYGCGIGRNVLFLKQYMPHLECYGYELCSPGVTIARAAAESFGLDVRYAQLDYVSGAESDFVFPKTDVAFTMYSLEQLPLTNKVAVENILRHVNHGSIHIEPVRENYPYTLRGIIGRVDQWKADYLRDFERNVSSIELAEIKREYLNSSHSPLVYPTLYVLRKSPRSA